MSRKEVPRAGLRKAAAEGQISNAQVAVALYVSERQVQRLKARYRAEGAAGLRHRLRGRPAPRALSADVRRRAGELLQTTYRDVNDCHAAEKLREVEGLRLSRASVQRLRRALGLPAKHRRRPRQYRARRTPEVRMGALVQLDASWFDWLEGRGPAMTLHGAIDDATGHDLPDDEIWRLYMLLTRAEAAFRAIKSPLMERPIFHHLEKRVQTHIFL